MHRPGGFLIATGPDGVKEWDTFTCCHCQAITIVPARAAPDDCGGFCRLCMRMTCKACAGKECTPFEKQLERAEARHRSLRSMGLVT
jgi:hypothetical protein